MHSVIRVAGQADLAVITAIVDRAYAPYVARIGRRPGPMDDDYPALVGAGRVHVLERDGTVLGVLVLLPEPGATLLDNIAVDPSAQGTGVGGALLRFAEDAARAAGHVAIRLYTHQRMTENVALYARHGYVETHRAEQSGFPRVFMTKPLRVLQSGPCASPM